MSGACSRSPAEPLPGHLSRSFRRSCQTRTVIGLLLIALLAATSLLLGAVARLPSLVSTLLVAYLALVANVGLVTIVLSQFREVTRPGLAAAEVVLFAGASVLWQVRGRPLLPPAAARAAVSEVVRSPLTALFLAVAVTVLAYELLLALTVPANNWDSLTYHLARAAAWAQHGGIFWIPNAPTGRLNEFQPLAEQEILYLLVATGSGALFALPQYLAELAILVAVYGIARRLGFEVRAAACSAFLLATFTLVALEATTAQNDLVAASFPAVAACLVLGSGGLEWGLAGAAVGLGLGAKLTTALVLPVVACLALIRGRRTAALGLAGAVIGFASIGMWGYVLNNSHTGQLLGHGQGRIEDTASPSYPGSVATFLDVLYQTMDLSALSDRLIHVLALVGILAATAAASYAIHRSRVRHALFDAAAVAIPFLAPLIVIGGAGVLAYITRWWGFPVRGRGGIVGDITRVANEDLSAFGPLGAVALLTVIVASLVAFVRRRADARQFALALALPSFLVFLSLEARWNEFLTRFLLVPAVLAAPLLARLFRGRGTTAAYLAVATITAGLTLEHEQTKPLQSTYGRPWELSRVQALDLAGAPDTAAALAAYEALVPPRACVGAILGVDEPSYLLFGPSLHRRVLYLSVDSDAVLAAYRAGLFYVVISTGPNRWVAEKFRAAGWSIRPLASYWLLAVAPNAGSGDCPAA